MNVNEVKTAIMGRIAKSQRILVYRHTDPDPDAIGTQLGLVRLLTQAFPTKTVIAMAPVPQRLQWIGRPTTGLTTPQSDDLVIAVDCANHERLAGDLATAPFIIKIDHHPNRDPYGQLNWVDETYSSCAEMIYHFACAWAAFTVTPAVAAALYAGIIGDTVRFSTPETSARTLQIASELVAQNIDPAKISHHAMDLTPKLSKLYGYVLSNLTVESSGLAHVTLSQTVLRTLGIPYGAEDAIVPLPGNLTTVQVWLIFVATPQGNYRVHLRSKSQAVDTVAKQFNGGGHALASGTFVPDTPTIQRMIEAMESQLKNNL